MHFRRLWPSLNRLLQMLQLILFLSMLHILRQIILPAFSPFPQGARLLLPEHSQRFRFSIFPNYFP